MKACSSFQWMIIFCLCTNSNILMVIKLKATIIGTDFKENFFFSFEKCCHCFTYISFELETILKFQVKTCAISFRCCSNTIYAKISARFTNSFTSVNINTSTCTVCVAHTQTHAHIEQTIPLNHNAQLKPFKVNKIKIWMR